MEKKRVLIQFSLNSDYHFRVTKIEWTITVRLEVPYPKKLDETDPQNYHKIVWIRDFLDDYFDRRGWKSIINRLLTRNRPDYASFVNVSYAKRMKRGFCNIWCKFRHIIRLRRHFASSQNFPAFNLSVKTTLLTHIRANYTFNQQKIIESVPNKNKKSNYK